jgi:hypothetical protein
MSRTGTPASDAHHLDRRERREIVVLRQHNGAISKRRCGDPRAASGLRRAHEQVCASRSSPSARPDRDLSPSATKTDMSATALHKSSMSAPRTSARSFSRPSSAWAWRRTMSRSTEEGAHGSCCSTCGTNVGHGIVVDRQRQSLAGVHRNVAGHVHNCDKTCPIAHGTPSI